MWFSLPSRTISPLQLVRYQQFSISFNLEPTST